MIDREPDQHTGAPEPATRPKGRGWLWGLAAIGVLAAWNAVVAIPVASALSGERGATTIAYRRWLVSPNEIVFDVWSVAGTQSMADMDRHLFKAAEALREKSFQNVVLAYHGKARFLMDGSYFQEIGATRQTQNPVYTMRTMQERLRNPDGTPAFDSWTGGWLGVLNKQIEDHNAFHRGWWVGAELGLPEGA